LQRRAKGRRLASSPFVTAAAPANSSEARHQCTPAFGLGSSTRSSVAGWCWDDGVVADQRAMTALWNEAADGFGTGNFKDASMEMPADTDDGL
jgi:hypothetical protein